MEEPHAVKWFCPADAWIEEIEFREPEYSFIKLFIVEVEKRPVDFCQYYNYSRSGESWNGNIPVEGCYSIDYLIGDTEYLGKGYGTATVKQLVDKIIENTNVIRIIVQFVELTGKFLVSGQLIIL